MLAIAIAVRAEERAARNVAVCRRRASDKGILRWDLTVRPLLIVVVH